MTAHADGSDGEDWASLLRSFSVLRWERGWFKFAEDFVVGQPGSQLQSRVCSSATECSDSHAESVVLLIACTAS